MKPINGSGTLTGSNESPWIILNDTRETFNTSILVGAPGGVTGKISLVYSLNTDYESTPTYMQKPHVEMDDVDVVANGALFVSLLSPCMAIKFKGNTIAGGSINYEVIQSGPIN